MKLNRHNLLISLTLILAFPAVAGAQSPAEQIRAAHGGQTVARLENYQIRGKVELTDPETGGVRLVPFLLKIGADRSRLETDGTVRIGQGIYGQWFEAGGSRSTPRKLWEGGAMSISLRCSPSPG